MRTTLLLLFSLCFAGLLQAQVSYTIDLTEAGTLKAKLTESGNLQTITNLIVTGNIDARDFKTIKSSMTALTDIDLSGVMVMAYTGTDGVSGSGSLSLVYLANEIPNSAFSFNAKMKSILLPSTITSIGEEAFASCSALEQATIPLLVTSIGRGAFYDCKSLAQVTIPSGVTEIGVNTFRDCIALTEILIPSSVVAISSTAFYGSSPSFYVDGENKSYSSVDGVLYDKDQKVLVKCPTAKKGTVNIPSTVELIGEFAFLNCTGLTSIAMPSSVIEISYGAFQNCSELQSVEISNSTTLIGGEAFSYCYSLSFVTIPNSVTIIGPHAFFGCQHLLFVDIPNSVTTIYDGAFANCGSLISLTIPSSVTQLGGYLVGYSNLLSPYYINVRVERKTPLAISPDVFSEIINLTTAGLSVPRGTKAAYQQADVWKDFQNITEYDMPYTINLTEAGTLKARLIAADNLTIVGKLTITGNIDARDFKTMRDDMPVLKYVDIKDAKIVAYTGTMGTDRSLSSVVYPSNTIPQYAFFPNSTVGNTMLESIVFPTSNVAIGQYAFKNCTGLRGYFTIPTSVKAIASSSFYGCTELTSVTLPEGLTAIEASLFANCTKLIAIKIPSTVQTINSGAFSNCQALKSVTLPSALNGIGSSAMSGCSSLTTISIPSSTTQIGTAAFDNCTNLKSIDVKSVTPIDLSTVGSVFANVDKTLCTLYVPEGSMAAYQTAVQWKDFIHIIDGVGFWPSTQALTIIPASNSAALYINSNTVCSVTTDVTWLMVSPTSVTGNAEVKVTAQPNPITSPRTATITVTAGSNNAPALSVEVASKNGLSKSSPSFAATASQASQTITVTQAAGNATLSVSAPTASFAEEASQTTIGIISNTAWTASDDAPWLTISPASATGNGTVVLTAEANAMATERTAIITISAIGTPTFSVVVTQSGNISTAVFDVEKQRIAISPNPSVDVFTITAGDATVLLTIVDLSGRTVHAQQVAGKTTVNIGNLKPGIYLVTVNNHSTKLVKQ